MRILRVNRRRQRRNIGYIEAYNRGAEIIATVDDDNMPYDNWGENCMVGKEVEVDVYTTDNIAFEPLSITNENHLWHRGYPIEEVHNRKRLTRHRELEPR